MACFYSYFYKIAIFDKLLILWQKSIDASKSCILKDKKKISKKNTKKHSKLKL